MKNTNKHNLDRKVTIRFDAECYSDLETLARLSGARDVSKYVRLLCKDALLKSQDSIKKRRDLIEDIKAI